MTDATRWRRRIRGFVLRCLGRRRVVVLRNTRLIPREFIGLHDGWDIVEIGEWVQIKQEAADHMLRRMGDSFQ